MTNSRAKGKFGELRKMMVNQVPVNPNQVLNQVLQVQNQVPGGYWGGCKLGSCPIAWDLDDEEET